MTFPADTKLSPATQERIKRFTDWFIRSDYVQNWTAENDSDFINCPERAARCYDAAKFGADGKTHAEVIGDWRHAFDAWIRDKRKWTDPEHFMSAVHEYFDSVETWHENNGSLHQEIG